MSTPFKMKGFSGFGNSPINQVEEEKKTTKLSKERETEIWKTISKHFDVDSTEVKKMEKEITLNPKGEDRMKDLLESELGV